LNSRTMELALAVVGFIVGAVMAMAALALAQGVYGQHPLMHHRAQLLVVAACATMMAFFAYHLA
jgi:hypothetical protein